MRSVGNRIAVNLNSLNLPVSSEIALEALKSNHIYPIEVNVPLLAKSLVGKAKCKMRSRQSEAPEYFDCSSFTKWLYGQKGMWIPRRPLQQFQFCKTHGSLHQLNEVAIGDIFFLNNPYRKHSVISSISEIAHVGLVAEENRIICVTNSTFGNGVIEIPIDTLLEKRTLHAIGRVGNEIQNLTTLVFPAEREVETGDDIRWIILQSL